MSDGKGTVFDAAKLAREYGIGDPAQLKALGKPGASGFWKDGIAIGRLPEDVFTAAVNEQIKLKQAVAIGESGASEEKMRAAYRMLVERGKDAVPSDVLARMLKRPSALPEVMAGDAAGQQKLPGFDDYDATFEAQAKLEAAIVAMLKREKNLFGFVGRKSGQIERVGQVDAAAAKGISDEAAKSLTVFDRLVYQTGPIMDLINEGTPKVVAGQLPSDVAAGLKNRLAAAIKAELGQEVAPATDVVQEDMFAAAGRQADETPQPVELTPEQRDAAEARLLQEAIAGGEVRPPNAPIPELPAPAQVRLDELDPSEPITPGSKAAQALADETRLALEHARADAALQEVQERALKDANDYELLTFDQKKDAGLTAGLDKAITPEVLPPEGGASIADLFAEQARQLAQSDARLYRRTGEAMANIRQGLNELAAASPEPTATIRLTSLQRAEIENFNSTLMGEMGIDLDGPMTREQLETLERNIRSDFAPPEQGGIDEAPGATRRSMIGVADRMRKAINEMGATPSLAPAPVRPEPVRLVQPAPQPELLLPQDLRKASPRYGRNTITFQSDLDRAAYVLANDAVKPSKSAAKFRQVVQEAGLNIKDVVAHGQKVKAALKQAAKGNPGQIELPAQRWGDDVKPQPQAAADRLQRQIGDIDQQITDNRRKAEQEGC